MHLGKTKVMFDEHAKKCTITVNGETIKEFDSYVYLGKTVTKDDDLLPEIGKRITLGWAAFGKVDNIMRSRKASMKIKRKIHDEYILPVMTYGCETWALNNAMMDKLAVAQRKMERIMLGITLRDRKRNTWIRQETDVSDTIKAISRQLSAISKQNLDGQVKLPGYLSNRMDPKRLDQKTGTSKKRWRDDLTTQILMTLMIKIG